MKRARIFAGLFSAAVLLFAVYIFSTPVAFAAAPPSKNPNDQGIGMQGRLQQPAPTNAPTISLPVSNTHYTELPVTATGLCETDLLVRLYKNNVFTGSDMCENGSFSIQLDLFPGQNVLHAIQYDDLDQASPKSNEITLIFDIAETTIPGTPDQVAERITLTSTFARLGADPGTDLIWPISISGGTGPYALSIDWGDGKSPQLLSQSSAGTFNMTHKYDRAGVYKVVVKATDKNNVSSFIQLVGIANGKVTPATGNTSSTTGPVVTRTRVLWQPAAVCVPLLLTTFWLGKKYQLKRTRYRMKHRILPIDK